MITIAELNKHKYTTTPEIDENLSILLDKLTMLEQASGLVFVVTSGLRSMENQMAINPSATHSKHLTGQAADIYDPDKKLQEWCLANVERLEGIGVWCEAFPYTHNWVHFQIVPSHSGHRFFIP